MPQPGAIVPTYDLYAYVHAPCHKKKPSQTTRTLGTEHNEVVFIDNYRTLARAQRQAERITRVWLPGGTICLTERQISGFEIVEKP